MNSGATQWRAGFRTTRDRERRAALSGYGGHDIEAVTLGLALGTSGLIVTPLHPGDVLAWWTYGRLPLQPQSSLPPGNPVTFAPGLVTAQRRLVTRREVREGRVDIHGVHRRAFRGKASMLRSPGQGD